MSFKYEKNKKNVVTITLDRQEVHNAFNEKLIEDLTKKFREIDQDKSVEIVVLTGEGKSFCAGADVNWMKKMKGFTSEQNYEDSWTLSELFNVINRCSKTVIGKVHGYALGGGVGLVCCCDYVISSNDSVFGLTEVRLGLIPAVISPYVISKIGESWARAYFLSGERFDAEKALQMNMIHEVCSLGELDQKVEMKVKEFLKAGPEARRRAKDLIYNISPHLLKDEIREYTCQKISKVRISDEAQEGMTSLLEKRKPNWLNK